MSTRATAMALHPAGPLTEEGIAARRAALEDEELGLAGLVPVDRIIATVGGIVGGAVVMAVAIGVEVNVRRLRKLNARDEARA